LAKREKEIVMSVVVADMSMSLDGFVADRADGVQEVFAWYGKPQPAAAAEDLAGLGVIVYGRRTFELAEGWDGNHPTGVPVIVITHEIPEGWPRKDSTVSFVTEGVESALERARQLAGDKMVAIGSPSITQQLLNAGLLDEIRVKIVSVFLGEGIRFFEGLRNTPIELEGPDVTTGNGVTHLHYRVPGAHGVSRDSSALPTS
jgi:dihydrofolate reductase